MGLQMHFSGLIGAMQTKKDRKKEEGYDQQQNNRIAVPAIKGLLFWCTVFILLHGHGHHIANASLIQVAYCLMMALMFIMPPVIGCVNDKTRNNAGNLVCPGGFKKGTMAAIVENDKYPYHEAGSQRRYCKGEPV